MRSGWKVSVRRACRVLRFDPKTYRYCSRRPGQAALEDRIRTICQTRVRYGYRLVPVRGRPKDWDLVMRPVCRDPLPGPAIAVPCHQAVAVENACDQIIAGDQRQLPDGSDDVAGGAVAQPASPLRQAQFRMDPANPVDQEHEA
jgi:hypothetical protein